jgi:hypothetical protein
MKWGKLGKKITLIVSADALGTTVPRLAIL